MADDAFAGTLPPSQRPHQTRRGVLRAAAAAAGIAGGIVAASSAEPASAATGTPGALNVYDFGAVGDGAHDDTSAFQAAAGALPASGGSIYAPRGTFLLGTVNLTGDDVTLFGDGESTVLAKSSASPPISVSGSGFTLSRMRIVDNGNGGPAVQATAANQSDHRLRISDLTYHADSAAAQGLLIKDYSDVHIEGCVLEGLAVPRSQRAEAYSGINLTTSGTVNTTGAGRVLVRNNIVRGFAFGISSGSPADLTRLMIEGNHVEDATLYGLYIMHTPRVRVAANNIRNCHYGIWYDVGRDDGVGTSRQGEGPVFIGNQVSFCTDVGIGIGMARCATVTGNTVITCGDGIVLGDSASMVTVSGNTIYGNSGNGIVLDRGRVGPHHYVVYNDTIAANTIEANGQHGILDRGSGGTLVISANTIDSNGLAAAGTYSGIRIEQDGYGSGHPLVSVTGNVIANTNNAIPGPGRQAYGISVGAGAIGRLVLTGNYFGANATYCVHAPDPLTSSQTITLSGNHSDDGGYALPSSGLEVGLNFGHTAGLPSAQQLSSDAAVTGYLPVTINGVTYKLATIT